MLGLIVAQVDKALEVVDRASVASDRWLFLAMVVLILAGAGAAIRYLLRSSAEQQLMHNKAMTELQATHNSFMNGLYTENVKLTAQVLVVLQETNPLLRWFKEQREKEENGG